MKMRSGLTAFVATFLGALLIAGLFGVHAQQNPGKPPQSPTPQKQDDVAPGQISTTTVNVRLPVTVVDGKSGRFIVDLKQGDFEISEDKTQQRIESFLPQSDLPLDVAVLMDTSNSVKPKLKFERDAAISFLYTMLESRKDRALFATFDSEVELHQDFTNRLDLLTKAIDGVKAQGETRMYDAIYSVCEEKMAASPGRRRAMVIITDGEDTVSERTLSEAIDIAQRTETVIFVISTKSGGFFGVQAGTVDRKEDKNLKQMAEDTGGRAFFTAEVIELERSFTAIARELRSQYLIAYSPTNDNYDGKFRKIEVRLPARKELKVRTKTGYTAVPPRTVGVK
ncbi:MAG: VWA domain-containing protein [Acidobacteria bacterium]|nr:VWA domain-containing protein [Acidobacteriota bacterium]